MLSPLIGAITATEVPSQSEFGQSCAYDGTKYHTGATSAVLASRLKLKEFTEPKSKKGVDVNDGGK